MTLDPVSLRVLGALMEKEMVTPDIYPLSLNALLVASNQRSSREPVMELSEDEIRTALQRLEVESLVVPARDLGRVQRFEHRIRTVLDLRRDETAVLCLLLLRGPQTPGELRSRSDRMLHFDDLDQVQSTLERMAARGTPIVATVPRPPGSREVRWRHTLGEYTEAEAARDGEQGHSFVRSASGSAAQTGVQSAAIAALEARVAILEQRLGISAEDHVTQRES